MSWECIPGMCDSNIFGWGSMWNLSHVLIEARAQIEPILYYELQSEVHNNVCCMEENNRRQEACRMSRECIPGMYDYNSFVLGSMWNLSHMLIVSSTHEELKFYYELRSEVHNSVCCMEEGSRRQEACRISRECIRGMCDYNIFGWG